MLLGKSCLSLGILLSWGVVSTLLPSQLVVNASQTSSTTNIETTQTPLEIPSIPNSETTDTPSIIPSVPNVTPTDTPSKIPSTTPNVIPTNPPPKTPTNTKTLATHLILKLKERKLYVYQDKKVLSSYVVAIGKKGWETPTGKFQIIKMTRDPIWQSPWTGKVIPAGTDNPLGVRWIGFWTNGKDTIGFHGTKGENLLGKAVSHGCVRMRNRDIVVLFDMVKMGTPVIVQL